ncbi:MAG: hypothetical protein HOM55_03625 [Proteobacteria bacterium]|jgi:hypothetical protein|nr:hypothetical protein [Pseudomonadota bacterium]
MLNWNIRAPSVQWLAIQWLAISLLLACLSSCATQKIDNRPSVSIIDYGLYEPLKVSDLGTSDEAAVRSPDEVLYTLKRRTEDIPVIPFTRFGFEWCAENFPLGIHTLYLILEHPREEEDVRAEFTTKRIFRRSKTNGKKNEMCSTETWEMSETDLRTGDIWTLGIWDEINPLVTREFRFITPDDYFQSLP